MEIHQLTYFVAVAETGGFGKGAKRCNVAQPSLSQQIMKLEQELGQKLFDRLGRKIALTDAGKALLPKARMILAEVQAIHRNLNQEIAEGAGELAIGVIPTIAPFLLPNVIKRFADDYPRANLSVNEDVTDELIKKLIEGSIDIAILSLPIHHKLIETEELCTENLLVASPKQHDLIHRASLKTKELQDYPFIALNEVHCLGEQVQSFCYQADVNLEIVCFTSQLSTVHSCIAAGLGVSLVPQVMAATDQSGSHQLPHRDRQAAQSQNRSGHPYRAQSFIFRPLFYPHCSNRI